MEKEEGRVALAWPGICPYLCPVSVRLIPGIIPMSGPQKSDATSFQADFLSSLRSTSGTNPFHIVGFSGEASIEGLFL